MKNFRFLPSNGTEHCDTVTLCAVCCVLCAVCCVLCAVCCVLCLYCLLSPVCSYLPSPLAALVCVLYVSTKKRKEVDLTETMMLFCFSVILRPPLGGDIH